MNWPSFLEFFTFCENHFVGDITFEKVVNIFAWPFLPRYGLPININKYEMMCSDQVHTPPLFISEVSGRIWELIFLTEFSITDRSVKETESAW